MNISRVYFLKPHIYRLGVTVVFFTKYNFWATDCKSFVSKHWSHNHFKLKHFQICWIFFHFTVGFYFGVNHLRMVHSLAQLHESTIITYFTTWGQIVFLFVLGSYGLLNTWLNLPQIHRLFLWITKIDRQLEEVTGRELNYTGMRKKLFAQFFVVFLVPSCLSMVNCIVLHFGPEEIDLFSACFWFVCFAPILLLTLKEFQFYNLMYVLKTKFDLINKELLQYGGDNLLSCRKRSQDNMLNSIKPECSTDVVKKLLEIYSNIADCADLLLNVFAWHLLFLTSASFGVITVQGYNLFAALILHSLEMDSYQLFVVLGWVLVQITVIGINVGTCCMTAKAVSIVLWKRDNKLSVTWNTLGKRVKFEEEIKKYYGHIVYWTVNILIDRRLSPGRGGLPAFKLVPSNSPIT